MIRYLDGALASKPVLEEISIVIPTLGRPILETCLHWIAQGSRWPAQLIVVDQGCNPAVATWMQQLCSFGLDARYVPSTQRGRAAGVNRGVEHVQTRFVAITDDDCFVDSDWLKNMTHHLNAHSGTIVTGRVEAAGDDVAVVVTSQTPAIYRRPRLFYDSLSGGNMGAPMSIFECVGPLDEDCRLRTAEDGEWAYRVLRAGVPILYAPDVCVWHYGWRSKDSRAAQYMSYARSHGGFYGKYLRKGDWFIALRAVVHHIRALRRWWRGIRTGNRELALYGRAYFTCLLPGIIAGLRKRRGA